MPETAANYLDPLTLAQVRGLELQARLVVEGYLSGQHRSPHHGFAVEFAQHREYAPGDDVKHIDWKVFGRTERYYLKQYEQETNLVCWLLVDASQSMAYGSGPVRKYDYACMAAASLAYLIVQQSDSVGLAVFDAQVRRFLRPARAAVALEGRDSRPGRRAQRRPDEARPGAARDRRPGPAARPGDALQRPVRRRAGHPLRACNICGTTGTRWSSSTCSTRRRRISRSRRRPSSAAWKFRPRC